MRNNFRRVDDSVDNEGYVISGYSAWDCENCGEELRRYRGQSDIDCDCGACYNASGQRLRDNWRNNPSNYSDDIGDMEGYEMEYADDF